MHILFFDTSCDFILVGIYSISHSEIKEEYFYAANHPREASYRLISDIEFAMTEVNIEKPDAIVCCFGPGSFTGIRISVTTARDLSQIWKIPTFGLDTLEMYSTYYTEYYKTPVITAIDGKQKKVFAGFSNGKDYKGTYDIYPSEISTLFQEELNSNKTLIISDLEIKNRDYTIVSHLPKPTSLLARKIPVIQALTLQDNSYDTLLPNYMRETYVHTSNYSK